MRVGCGLEVRNVRGRHYLYLWSYQVENGHSRRIWKYLGPVGRGDTKRKALNALTAYYTVAKGEMERKLGIVRMKLAGI